MNRVKNANHAVFLYLALICGALFVIAFFSACSRGEKSGTRNFVKIKVVASLYPVYDFAKQVGGERVDVSLLLPPGEEPHSFDPRPTDILNLNKADIFIFTNVYMEPWVGDIIKSIDNKNVVFLDASEGITFIEGKRHDHTSGHETHGGDDHRVAADPHVWLDFDNTLKMVDNIREALIKKDPSGSDYYRSNAEKFKAAIIGLDTKYKSALQKCKKKIFINGGHFAFGYLAKRYGLTYLSAYGISPDSEPTPGQIAKIVSLMKRYDLKYIFHEELLMPRVARIISKETGAELLLLHGAHNISREDFERRTSFIEIMEMNLENLKKGLECPEK